MKLVFYWDELEETYEGETWKECCEDCVSQEENWDVIKNLEKLFPLNRQIN